MSLNVILFGASKLGETVYDLLKNEYNILFYCDNDSSKWGKEINGLKIISPKELKNLKDCQVIITSQYADEISEQLQDMGLFNIKVFNYSLNQIGPWNSIKRNSSDIKCINLGKFLYTMNEKITINDLTFIEGGSGLLDYIFLKALMRKFNLKTYLEIGTFMGESIASISEIAQNCYSISLPDDHISLVKHFEKMNKMNLSRFFSYKKENIVHYFENSRTFNFSKITEKIDLVFIDGDHTYEGVKMDTKNIFEIIDPRESIVVWHDFKQRNNIYYMSTVQAVYESIPSDLHKNIFGVDKTMCGVYLPDKYIKEFDFSDELSEIYSYEMAIKAKHYELLKNNQMKRG